MDWLSGIPEEIINTTAEVFSSFYKLPGGTQNPLAF